MTYQDALQDCLEVLRSGRDLDSAVTRFPEHAAQLRADLALTTALRGLATTLPAPSERATGRFEADLAAARQQRLRQSVVAPPREPWWRSLLAPRAAAGFVAATALVAVLAIVLLGGLPGLHSGTAEASTLEGLVVENANGTLTLQTADGLASVSLAPGAALTDVNGAGVDVSTIQAGQYLTISGKRIATGKYVAKLINLKSAEALQAWCVDHLPACTKVTEALQTGVGSCGAEAAACPLLKARLQELRGNLGNLTRLADLRNRCQKGGKAACQQLLTLCNDHADQCQAIQDWLKTYRAGKGK